MTQTKRNIKNKWDNMQPDGKAVCVLGVLYVLVFIGILIFGFYVKTWN